MMTDLFMCVNNNLSTVLFIIVPYPETSSELLLVFQALKKYFVITIIIIILIIYACLHFFLHYALKPNIIHQSSTWYIFTFSPLEVIPKHSASEIYSFFLALNLCSCKHR